MKVKRLSLVVWPGVIPRCSVMALTILSLPQPPSWQGVYGRLVFAFSGVHSIPKAGIRIENPYRSANLNKILAHWFAVVHGIESGNLVDAHRRHLQQPCNLIHDADTSVTMLALAQIEKGHDGGLLVLRGVALEDLIDEFEVLLGELEGDGRVVGGGIAVLGRTVITH